MAKDFDYIARKIINNIIKRQFRFPKALLFSLIMLVIFMLSVFLVKPNFQLFYESEEDEDELGFGATLGNVAIILLIISVIPFVVWNYFREIIQLILHWGLTQLKVLNPNQLQDLDVVKSKKRLYVTIRNILFNIHSIGCLFSCGLVIIHNVSLFTNHNGISFLFSWTAMLSGIYLSFAGFFLRFHWKTYLQLVRKANRAIHMQGIITIINILFLMIHINLMD